MNEPVNDTTTQATDWKCEACEGTGLAIPDCEECHGDGWVEDPEDGGTMTCPECGGDKCDVCGGSGERPGDTGATR